jgi:hypothetical protein
MKPGINSAGAIHGALDFPLQPRVGTESNYWGRAQHLYVYLASEPLYRLPNTALLGGFSDKDAPRTPRRLRRPHLGTKIILEGRFIAAVGTFYIRSDKSCQAPVRAAIADRHTHLASIR